MNIDKEFKTYLSQYLKDHPMVELEDWVVDILEDFFKEGFSLANEN